MIKPIKQIIHASFIGCILISAATLQAAYQPLDKIVAIVDDDVITQSDFDAKLGQVKVNFTRQNRPLPPQDEINKEIMDRLILESLQLQLARRAGVHISEDQLTNAVNNIAQRNGLSLAAFRKKMAAEGISFTDMRAQIRRDMTLQQVQQGHLRSRIQISDKEIENFLASAEGKAITTTRYEVSHILFPLAETASQKTVNEAQQDLLDLRSEIIAKLLDFSTFTKAGTPFREQLLSGANLGWRAADDLPSIFADVVITMEAGDISSPIRSGAGWHLVKLNQITGAAKVVHQSQTRHILLKLSEVRDEKQAKKQINNLYERLQKGEDFSLLAKEYSEDPSSALQGGDLGWSMPGQFVPAFEKTMASLQIGEVSQPFKSKFGWHIMQKMAERDHDMTLEGQKNKAYQALYERKFSEELDSWLLKIRDEAFIELK